MPVKMESHNTNSMVLSRWPLTLLSKENVKEGVLIDYKKLESIRGFLLYVARSYIHMTPYMKGFHLTLDGWRDDRDAEGWKQGVNQKVKENFYLSQDLNRMMEQTVGI